MGLADEILAFHSAILRVMIVEDRAGNLQGSGELSFVGMLYEERGLICASVDAATYMLVITPKESLLRVMEAFEGALPRVLDKQSSVSRPLAINSAAEADQMVRSFFANIGLCDPSSIRMQDATLNPNDHSWQISGVYRPARALLSKRYIVRLDARTGAVTNFQG